MLKRTSKVALYKYINKLYRNLNFRFETRAKFPRDEHLLIKIDYSHKDRIIAITKTEL